QLNERLQAENLRMSTELDILQQMQQLILPKPEELQEIDTLDIAGYMQPAAEMGGDYYDVLAIDGVVTIGIGDVTGHGLESGILMIMTQAAVRTLQEMGEDNPVRFLDTINRTIYKNVRRMNTAKNLTLAILTYADGNLSISGQHEEVLVMRHGGEVERIDTLDLGFPIGLEDNIAEFINSTNLHLQVGDGVVLYTDGITEAQNEAHEFYGIDRLCQVVSQNWEQPAIAIQTAIMEDLQAFMGQQRQFDDISLLIVKQK
ncbi:MAG: PP2C family protein-serine/threonine phosphatase, partial [Kamptonema sp. SIO4C4]|nr:PP2C family protein-serine/threonine phosphatase [Kamptonema sp. SIO4C4]